jgi:AcrR family transcriptional regulator
VSAGVSVMSEVGIDKITMQRVADRLGLGRTSVYHHFPNGLRELQAAVVEHVVQQADDNPPDQAPDAGIEGSLRVMARLAADYPDVVAYMLTLGRDEGVALDGSDRIVRALESAGFGAAVPEAFQAVNAFATGWAFLQQSSPEVARAAGFPALATAVEGASDLAPEDLLLHGVRWLIAGMRAELAVRDGDPGAGRTAT